MKRAVTYIIMAAMTIAAWAQDVSYNHDSAKMNQFTVAEIGTGGLTPTLYYDLLHSSYAKTAATKNKLGFRTTASIAAYWQVDDATALDSAMIKRAEIEALNIADRTGGVLDMAWMAEGDKITSKLNDFSTNITRILQTGGVPSQQTMWKEKYNMYKTAITAMQDAYQPNSQRKKQYLQIYADLCRDNETLIRYIVYLSNSKSTASLLAATYEKPDRKTAIVAEAMGRWRNAGWSAIGKNTTSGSTIDNDDDGGGSGSSNSGWILIDGRWVRPILMDSLTYTPIIYTTN